MGHSLEKTCILFCITLVVSCMYYDFVSCAQDIHFLGVSLLVIMQLLNTQLHRLLRSPIIIDEAYFWIEMHPKQCLFPAVMPVLMPFGSTTLCFGLIQWRLLFSYASYPEVGPIVSNGVYSNPIVFSGAYLEVGPTVFNRAYSMELIQVPLSSMEFTHK